MQLYTFLLEQVKCNVVQRSPIWSEGSWSGCVPSSSTGSRVCSGEISAHLLALEIPREEQNPAKCFLVEKDNLL